MNAYYETFLRKDIFNGNQHYADIICDIYDQNPQEREYIKLVLEHYIHGGSVYNAYSHLLNNVIRKNEWINKNHAYLDEEYQNAMAK